MHHAYSSVSRRRQRPVTYHFDGLRSPLVPVCFRVSAAAAAAAGTVVAGAGADAGADAGAGVRRLSVVYTQSGFDDNYDTTISISKGTTTVGEEEEEEGDGVDVLPEVRTMMRLTVTVEKRTSDTAESETMIEERSSKVNVVATAVHEWTPMGAWEGTKRGTTEQHHADEARSLYGEIRRLTFARRLRHAALSLSCTYRGCCICAAYLSFS